MRCCLVATTMSSMLVLGSVVGCGTASSSACTDEELHPSEEDLSRLELAIAQATREFDDASARSTDWPDTSSCVWGRITSDGLIIGPGEV